MGIFISICQEIAEYRYGGTLDEDAELGLEKIGYLLGILLQYVGHQNIYKFYQEGYRLQIKHAASV